MPIYTLDTLTTKYNTLGETDKGMNALAPAIRVQDTPQRTQFTMVPNILIDGFDELSDAARFAFIKFMRLVRKVGYFAGSIRKLGKKLKVANMTINRMVAAWEKFSLVRVEPIDDIDAVRVIPLTDLLWQTNTDHYQYAPAEVREPVTICDTISTTDTSETDRVVTNLSQNVTPPVTNCDTVSQPQAQNDPQYLYKNIGNNKRENISSTSVDDALPPYEDGYQGKSPLSGWLADITLMDDAFLAEMEKLLPSADVSTPVIPTVDNETLYPIASPKTTRKKASKPKPEPAAAPTIQLTEQQQAFWLLWCDTWFNQDIPPELNETAYKHVKKLAPLVKTKEQLEDLVKHARVEMEASGFKRKVVHLGNLVNSYPGWKQQSRPIAPGVAVPQNFTGMGRLLHIKPQEANRGQTFTS